MVRQVFASIALLFLTCNFLSAEIVLDFEGTALSNGNAIPQTYGDTAFVDISYRELDGFGNAIVVDNDLHFWATEYGDLGNVVWGFNNNVTQVAEIRFDSLVGADINLMSLDVADWDGTANDQAFRVFDANYNLLFELTNFDVDDVFHDTISPNVSAETLILQWDNPWAVAADNITFSAVPEPTSLLTFGVACLLLSRRRRS